MWGILANLIGGPIVNAVVGAYKAKLSSENSTEAVKADIAQRELSAQTAEIKAQAQIRIAEVGYWYEPDKLMGYCVAVYFGKLLIWDKVLAMGATDPLHGFAATAANLIIMFYFGKRGFENIMRIWKR